MAAVILAGLDKNHEQKQEPLLPMKSMAIEEGKDDLMVTFKFE